MKFTLEWDARSQRGEVMYYGCPIGFQVTSSATRDERIVFADAKHAFRWHVMTCWKCTLQMLFENELPAQLEFPWA